MTERKENLILNLPLIAVPAESLPTTKIFQCLRLTNLQTNILKIVPP